MRNRTSFRVAFCGVLAALMVVLMLLGTMIPATEYLCPALAGVLIIPVVWEFGGKSGGLLYAAVALLSLILAPNKEAALFFVLLFGWYPLARPRLQHLKAKALRVVLKLVLFNAALAAIFALLLFVLTALALGMSFGAAAAGPQRLTLSLLLVVLLIVPCLWASGSAVMQDTAALWRQSAGFWAGLVLTAAALVLSLVRRQGTRAQGVLLLCGALLVRVAFFSATVHTASRLGMPY